MEFYKKLFLGLFIIFVLIIAWKIVPIYYKSTAIKSICKENADRIFKYNKGYIMGTIESDLNKLNIPKSKRQHNVTKAEDGTFVEIYYEDTADFFGYYQRKFEFYHECKAATEGLF
ncbi:MAG: hypothetical protein ACRENO_04190 [Thermodesulfobacteriota bacterium]